MFFQLKTIKMKQNKNNQSRKHIGKVFNLCFYPEYNFKDVRMEVIRSC